MVGTDTDSDITEGVLECSYQQGNANGQYDITASGFSSPNYTISYTQNKLYVSKLNSSVLDIEFVNTPNFTYDGTAKTPEVVVKHNGNELTFDTDYTIEYLYNTEAGVDTAKVKFSFVNFDGERELTFSIAKKEETPVISIAEDGQKYKGVPFNVAVSGIESDGEKTFFYQKNEGGTWADLSEAPKDAGTYRVRVDIAATDNYAAYVSGDKDFVEYTINQRVINISSGSKSWEYDGGRHSFQEYTITGDDFVTGDGFKNIIVNTTVTNVEDTADGNNAIEYHFTSVTNSENYDVRLSPGTLTITTKRLATPSSLSWRATKSSEAHWAAVHVTNQTVLYDVYLYRKGGGSEATPIATATDVSSTSVDFRNAMISDSETNGPGAYYFKVVAKIPGNTNFENSYSAKADVYTYTAKITVTKGDDGIGTVSPGDPFYLMKGESQEVNATKFDNYDWDNNSPVWTTNDNSIRIGEPYSTTGTTIYLDELNSAKEITVTAHTLDTDPEIEYFKPVFSSDRQSFKMSFKATDAVGIKEYAITKGVTDQNNVNNWVAVTPVTILEISDIGDYTGADQKGTYTLWVKDTKNNVVSANADVYKITFDGNGANDSTLMENDWFYKTSDETVIVTLPANKYEKTGYDFAMWSGNTGSYSDRGVFTANSDDTLKAQWEIVKVTYWVKGYIADPNDPTKYAEYKSTKYQIQKGSRVSAQNHKNYLELEGVVFDAEKSGNTVYTINNNNEVTIEVYYKRNGLTVTYKYQDVDETTWTDYGTQTYSYGQKFNMKEPPVRSGYTFVGWSYGEAGKLPETMPNKDITVTGYYVESSSIYTKRYFFENIDDGKFTENENYKVMEDTSYGKKYTFERIDQSKFDGFYLSGMTTGVPNDTAEGATSPVTLEIGTDNNYVNFYYRRTAPYITQYVYKDNKLVSNKTLSDNSIKYGTVITSAEMKEYLEKAKEGVIIPDGYVLSVEIIGVDWEETDDFDITMPDVSIRFEVHLNPKSSSVFKIETYFQNANLSYPSDPNQTLEYFGYTNENVSVIESAGISSKTEVASGDLIKTFNSSTHDLYEIDTENSNNKLSDTVLSNGNTVLKVYFRRKIKTTKISFYEIDSTGKQTELKELEMNPSAVWGSAYTQDIYDEILSKFGFNGTDNPEGYCAQGYLISYSGYYYSGDSGHWPNSKFTTVKQLTDLKDSAKLPSGTMQFGEVNNGLNAGNRLYIYFTKPVRDENIRYVTVKENKVDVIEKDGKNALSSVENIIPVVHKETIDGVEREFGIRITNEKDIFNSTYKSGTTNDLYPVLNVINGTYTKGNLKTEDGWKEITISGVKCYYNDSDNDLKDYLYIANPSNPYYPGNYYGASFETNYPGYDQINKTIAEYAAKLNPENYPRVNNRSTAGVWKDSDSHNVIVTYTDDIDWTKYARVNYRIGTTIPYSVIVSKQDGDMYTAKDPAGKYPEEEGRVVVWYEDNKFTKPMNTSENHYTAKTQTNFYGRYEKKAIYYNEYQYYELSKPITYGEDTYNSYLDEIDLELLVANGTLEKTESTGSIRLLDEFKRNKDFATSSVTYTTNDIYIYIKK
ncbi:MAG: InlB B-repeat-containing protein [Erysipelotrichaceae bacterium]|nr:InlB B-repeat-containing protein [Erysipelotrichaceae bacterium]